MKHGGKESWLQSLRALHERSISIVGEVQGLLHEMRHAVAVPDESSGNALLDTSMMEAETAADAGTSAEPAAATVAKSPSTELSAANNTGGSPAPAQTQAMVLSPPNSPPSSPLCATGRQEAALLREASDTLAARSAQRRDGDDTSLWPLPRDSRAMAARGKGGGQRTSRDDRR